MKEIERRDEEKDGRIFDFIRSEPRSDGYRPDGHSIHSKLLAKHASSSVSISQPGSHLCARLFPSSPSLVSLTPVREHSCQSSGSTPSGYKKLVSAASQRRISAARPAVVRAHKFGGCVRWGSGTLPVPTTRGEIWTAQFWRNNRGSISLGGSPPPNLR